MGFATTDLLDAHPEAQACEPRFADFGGRVAFHGPIATASVFEDNALVRGALETAGRGRVLVVDGGGSTRCALLGGNLARLGLENGWTGVVLNGCVRDSEEIAAIAIGVKALGKHPRKSAKGVFGGRSDEVVVFAGVAFRPGAWLYADADGIVVSETPIHA